jgi:hypothetical protein
MIQIAELSGTGLLLYDGDARNPKLFPWTLWSLDRWLVTIFHAIVLLGLAYRSQRLVIEGRQLETFLQFFRKLLQRLQVVCGRGDFRL